MNYFSNIIYYFSNVLCCTGPIAAHFWTAVDNAPKFLYCVELKTRSHLEAIKFVTLVLVALAAIPEII